MDHVLSAYGLRMTYLREPRAIKELDQERVLDDLSDEAPDGYLLPGLNRHQFTDCDHLVLVASRSTGRYLGFLAANDRATTQESFLSMETAFVSAAARGHHLLRRMIALTVLRIAGMSTAPSVIVACARDPLCYEIMYDTAQRFSRAVFFPNPESATIDFKAATLAQRIAREVAPNHRLQAATGALKGGMTLAVNGDSDGSLARYPQPAQWPLAAPTDRVLAMIDLRAADEASVLEDARRIYRAR